MEAAHFVWEDVPECLLEEAPPPLVLVASSRSSIILAWATSTSPNKGCGSAARSRYMSSASQDSGPPPTPRLGGIGVELMPRAISTESQSSAFGESDSQEERPNYRLQIKERLRPWQTIYWGYKTRLELDNMAPGDCFHFRVQKGTGPWSDTLAATTKDALVPMVVLHRAISQGLPHRARKFLSQRPLAVDVPDRAGRTALLLSILRGDPELVQLLLNAGADPNCGAEGLANRTPLMLAAHQGRAGLCRALRDRGARWDQRDRNGCTAMHYAAAGSKEEVVRMALEDGADLSARDSCGWTPLMRAVVLGAGLDVLALLLEAGSDPRTLDAHGHSAVHLASLAGRQNATALLARLGGDLRAKSRQGRTAIELGRCWPICLAEGADKGGVDATLAVAAAASTMLKKRAARRKQEEMEEEF